MNFKKICIFLIVIVTLLLFALISFSYINRNNTEFNGDLKEKNITDNSYIFEDKSRDLTIDDITSNPYQKKFIGIQKTTKTLNDSLSNFWLKFSITDNTHENVQLDLEVRIYQKQFYITSLTLYTMENDTYIKQTVVNKENYYKEGLKSSNPVFRLPNTNKGKETTYYLNMKGIRGFSLIVGKEKHIIDGHFDYQLSNGFIFGILFALSIIFNLVLYAFFRERAYLYFLIYMVFYIIQRLYNYGFLDLYCPFSANVLLYFVLLVMSLSMIFFILFVKNFLSNNKYFSKTTLLTYIAIALFTLFYILITLGVILDNNSFFIIVTTIYRVVVIPIYGILILILFLINHIKGNRYAKYLLVYITITILLQLFELLYVFGIKVFEIIYQFGYDINFILLALILVVGFFDRAHSTQREKEENQRKILEQQKKANIVLEKKVKERTRQLETANKKLEETNNELISLNQELTQTNTKLEESNIDLELTNTELEIFSSTLSHDLGNSISRINSALRLFMSSPGAEKLNQQENLYLNSITESSQRMYSIIKGILKLFSLSNKPINYQEFNLSLLAKKIVDIYIKEDQNRKIIANIHPDMLIKADYDQMQNAMENLISNAIKYTKEEEIARIEVGSMEKDGRTVYYVTDNGIGFDMGDSGKLFTKFGRLHQDNEYKGTGLGLVSVKRIITKHKGEVWAESSKGKGTTFYFTIGQ